jgi:hypothetical protein
VILAISIVCLWLSTPPDGSTVSVVAPENASVQQAASQAPTPLTSASPSELEEVELMQEEVGDRDPTYLRTHVIGRYDYRVANGSITTDRLRLKFQYAFGPFQRFGVSVLVPMLWRGTPARSASGIGDTEVQGAINVYRTDRLRVGAALQGTFRMSSDALLGVGSTTIKPSGALTAVLASRLELTGAVYYVRSIEQARGPVVNQLQPDVIANVRVGSAIWFVELDSFYDFRPERLAPTLKTGISDGFGPDRRWVINGYYSVGLNDHARLTQHRYSVGLDLTWFPSKYR